MCGAKDAAQPFRFLFKHTIDSGENKTTYFFEFYALIQTEDASPTETETDDEKSLKSKTVSPPNPARLAPHRNPNTFNHNVLQPTIDRTSLRESLGMQSSRLSMARMTLPCAHISTVFPRLMDGTTRSLHNIHARACASLRDSVLGLPHHESGISSGGMG